MSNKIKRTYTDMILLPTFLERYKYLRIGGKIGTESFGFDRYLGQALYKSSEWARIRQEVILRDSGCDLAIQDRLIFDRVVIHHMNPISVDEVKKVDDNIFNIEYLVCVSNQTHLAIHYGNEELLYKLPPPRRPGDTIPWRR